MNSLSFFHGNQLCQIAPERDGEGFIGLRNGRVVATAPDRASVARALIKAARWRKDQTEEAVAVP
ncbi:MAG: hypothetical protein P0Y52_14310 [Candidatus Brevundimonas phytovorans]|nr:hypothetical protein [Brevundimonas sp.]WEK57698.1 MAG: hypothetical protein P0Y52_14310 [Brevundimonas sp.]